MKKIVIVGKSGSGKDFLLRSLSERGLMYSPKYTTRPKRTFESEGVEYHFIDNDKFFFLNEQNFFVTYQKFDIMGDLWVYALSRDNFESNDIFVMTPHDIKFLTKEERESCYIIYLDIDIETRRQRIRKRNDNNDSVERRISNDEIDFTNFNDFDLRITNPMFGCDEILNSIELKKTTF